MESLSLKSLTLVDGMDSQEGVNGDLLDSGRWQNAWNQPFRGRALAALEIKLHLNAHAVRNDEKKEQMSRIIPVVQASGTGKSRLSEEYDPFLAVLIACRFVKHNFAVMLSLRNGSSFPHRVCLSHVQLLTIWIYMSRSISKTRCISGVILLKKLFSEQIAKT